ncbi:hypothetical protein BGZ83_008207 [Gryganskiella cystojenkinii]|nr:hypothetical protein BGZ83_008207 [Gryganskiella cystojenkinii]
MKFTLSVAVLALAASQAMAVVPIPIKGCTKTVVVTPADVSCSDFAIANGCTFPDLLKWNQKLSPQCTNLDVGAPICVSVTPGANSTVPSAPTGATTVGPKPTVTLPSGASTAGPAPVSTSVPPASSPSSPAAGHNAANGNKASMALAAAGVLLSVVYMF